MDSKTNSSPSVRYDKTDSSPAARHDKANSSPSANYDMPIKLDLSDGFRPDAQEIVTGRTCIIAQSGAGKSYTVAVLCEQMLKSGVPFCVIDTEGEYFSLKQKFELLWVGGEDSDVDVQNVDMGALARQVVREGVPLIFDVSDVTDQASFVASFCRALYDAETELRRPYLLIIEEADKFVPQTKPGVSSLAIEEIARRGRKRGLGLLIATQRPALVSKSALSQCGNQILGKLTTEADLAAVDLFFSSRKEVVELPRLGVGEFFVTGNVSRERIKFKAHARETAHTGLTPKLIPKPAQKISEIARNLSGASVSTFGRGETIAAVLQKQNAESAAMGSSGSMAIAAVLSSDDALKIAEGKRKKKIAIFGEDESLTSCELSWRPLVRCEVARPAGLLKKRIATISFMLDGKTGRFAEVKNGLRLKPGLETFLGLSEGAVKALLAVRSRPRATLAELQVRTGLSESGLRAVLDELRAKMLVTWNKEKNFNYYSPLANAKMPDMDRRAVMPELKAKAGGKPEKTAFGQADVRAIVKAADARSDVVRFEVFYYPFYVARFQGKSSRAIAIDGVSGRDIDV